MAEEFKYRAFISYSHRDKTWGDWLHRELESYRVPKYLVGTEGRDGPVAARLFPIFRDREELPTSDDLSTQITQALEQSANLIVVCSPNAATSRWVGEEIVAFKRLGRENRILAIIVGGEPNSDDKPPLLGPDGQALQECFPEALKFRLGDDGKLSSMRTEPVAADARTHADGKDNARLKLIAGLLGVGFDTLKQRDLEAKRVRLRRLALVAGGVIFALLSLLALSTLFLLTSEETRNEALIAQSKFLAQRSQEATASGDTDLGLLLALRALPGTIFAPERPITVEALGALTQARLSSHAVAVLRGHRDRVASAEFSPDGKRIATSSWDNSIRLWSVATGKLLAINTKQLGGELAFSPDGAKIVTTYRYASLSATTLRDNAMPRDELSVLMNSAGDAFITTRSVAFSPDGTRIVMAADDNLAHIYDAKTRAQLLVLRGHDAGVNSAAYSPDGTRILTASDDRTARIWDAGTGKQLVVLKGHKAVVSSAAFSPDGERVVTGSMDETAIIWDAATGRQLAVLFGHKANVLSVAFSPDGSKIATASYDNTCRIWSALDGTVLAVLRGHWAPIRSVAFSPDGAKLVTASDDGTARVWNVSPDSLATIDRRPAHVGLIVSPDGKRIDLQGNSATVVDVRTGRKLFVLTGHLKRITSAVFSPDGKRIATTSEDGTGRIWDALTGKARAVLQGHQAVFVRLSGEPMALSREYQDMHSARFSPDGTRIVTTSFDEVSWIWDAMTGKQLVELAGHMDLVRSAVYSPDGRQVLTASTDGTVRIWNSATGAQIMILRTRGHPYDAEYSPDGTMLAATSDFGTPGIWDAITGVQLAILRNGGGLISFSPDGKRVLAHGSEGSEVILDVATGGEIVSIGQHENAIMAAHFSPDGTSVETLSQDNLWRIWNVPRCQALIDESKAHAAAFHMELADWQRRQYFLENTSDSILKRLSAYIRPLFTWMLPVAGDSCV